MSHEKESPESSSYKIFGFVADGFEPVRRLFAKNFEDGLEDKSQLCVYFKGEKVVDLWGVMGDGLCGYDGESTTCIFSSTKVRSISYSL